MGVVDARALETGGDDSKTNMVVPAHVLLGAVRCGAVGGVKGEERRKECGSVYSSYISLTCNIKSDEGALPINVDILSSGRTPAAPLEKQEKGRTRTVEQD